MCRPWCVPFLTAHRQHHGDVRPGCGTRLAGRVRPTPHLVSGETGKALQGQGMPRPLAYFSAFEAAGKVMTFPGSGAQVGLQEYEPGTLRWRLVEDPPPTARWRYAAAMSGGRVYLFGGVPRGAGVDALRTTEEYRVPANPPAPDDRRY